MGFKPLIPSSPTRPKCDSERIPPSIQFNTMLSTNLHSTTLLLVGAIIQGTLILAIPRFWVLLPSVLILLVRFADTMAITFHFRPNPYLQDVVPQKWSAIIPDNEGNFSDTPADEKVAVLLLCAKINHPLGVFAPNVKEVGRLTKVMMRELDSENTATGFLGQTSYKAVDSRGAQELLALSYWRSIEDIHAYAEGPTHTSVINWWHTMSKKDPQNMKHIGIAHEIYEAPRSKWEAIAENFQPTRLGATSYLKKGDKVIGGTVDDMWISPVVEAKGRLRRSRGRLNWASNVNSSVSGSDDEKDSY